MCLCGFFGTIKLMSLTVRDVLSLNVLRGAKVVAGHRGLHNPIRWTHILDHPDVAPWVRGGEILLTSGYGIYSDPRAQIKYLRDAAEKKVAAVFIAVETYLPETTPQMREIADQYGVPLVELPHEIAFVEVTEAIIRRLDVKAAGAERDYLLDALLAGNLPENEETLASLQKLGIESGQPHALILAQNCAAGFEQSFSPESQQAVLGIINKASRQAVPAKRVGWLITVVPLNSRAESAQTFAQTLDQSLKKSLSYRVRLGVGRLARTISDFTESYREARAALFIGSLINDGRTLWHYDELGVWRLLLRLKDQTELEQFAETYLNRLTKHDREQLTNWVQTLETFLEQNGNLRATARALELHRNTVTYQLKSISQVLGQDLDSPEVRLNLQIAFRIRKLLEAGHNKNSAIF